MTVVDQEGLHRVTDSELDDRVPIVLIHGVGSNLTAWNTVAAELATHAPVLRYDLRGHGQSPRRTLPYTLETFVDDHLQLLHEFGIKRAHLVGFSLGAMIAQAVAIAHAETVDRLVLIGAVAGRTEAERARVTQRLNQARWTDRDSVAPNGERWFTAPFLREHPDVVAANLARQRDTDPVAYAAAYEVLATNDLADNLRHITAPTLAITGELDAGSPPHMSELIAERVPDAHALILPGYKHAVLDEIPQRIAAEIAEFLIDGEDAS